MTRHPMLPEEYQDRQLQAAILSALRAYENKDVPSNVSNPQMRWNLNRAWQDARGLLAGHVWNYAGNLSLDESTVEAGYELVADEESQKDDLGAIIAGLVALQILEPACGVCVRRVDYRKGGEMALVISSSTAEKLKKRIPGIQLDKKL